MASLLDFPELKSQFDILLDEKSAIQLQVAPLREQYNALRADIDALLIRQREIAEQIQAIERPRLAEIDRAMADIARRIGGLGTRPLIRQRR